MTFAALSGPAAVGISLDPQRVTAAAPIDLSAMPAPSPIAAIRVTEAGTTVAERPEILADGSAANGESVTTATGVVSSEGADAGLPGNLRLTHPVANFRLTSLFGWRKNPTGPGSHIHIGQDYAVPCGTPVRAAEAGVVRQSEWAGHSGYRVRIDHGHGIETAYSHNSQLVAQVGEKVEQGQLIALAGTTGNSTGCHVHFEVYKDGKWTNPAFYVPRVPGQPVPLSPEEQERVREAINPPRTAEPVTPAEVPVATGTTAPRSPSASAPPSATPSPSASPSPTAPPKATPSEPEPSSPEPSNLKPNNAEPSEAVPSTPPASAEPTPSSTPSPSPEPKPEPEPTNEATATPSAPAASEPTTTEPADSTSPEPTTLGSLVPEPEESLLPEELTDPAEATSAP